MVSLNIVEDGGLSEAFSGEAVALIAGSVAGGYQPLDSDLTAIAALSTTSFGRALLTQASASATCSYIGALTFVAAPAATGSSGVAGQVAYDSGFFYVCVATNTWKRTALSTW